MLKKLFIGLVLMAGLGVSANAAAPAVREQSFTAVGTGTTVSISTSAWTKVPTTSSLTGRTTICLDLPAAASANMAGIISSVSSTPAEATTVRPIEVIRGEPDRCIDIGDGLYLYLISLHSAAESVHVQERRK